MQEKAYKQLTSVLGDDEEPDGDSLQKMPYLGHLIKETQRLNKHCIHYMYYYTNQFSEKCSYKSYQYQFSKKYYFDYKAKTITKLSH